VATKAKVSNGNGRLEIPAQQHDVNVQLKPIDVRIFNLRLEGTSPLIVHKFSEKSKKAIEDKQQKKAKEAKSAREPKAEYLASFYVMPGSTAGADDARYGFPAAGFKNAAVDACSFIDGVTKVQARGSFHVIGAEAGLIEIKHAGVAMREDTVRIGMGALDLRYRPEFSDWKCELAIHYNAAVITPEQIVNLFNVAGFAIGVGEWRPQRDGSNGMFRVATS
jgi:hypothetical protein